MTTKVQNIKTLITEQTADLPTGEIGIGRKELVKLSNEKFGYTEQQTDNVLSYIRTVDPQGDAETWWFSEVRRNKYVYHPPVKAELEKPPVIRGQEIVNDPYPTDEAVREFKKEELFKFLKGQIEAVVAVDGTFNTKTNREELIKITLKVTKYLRRRLVK